jgi:hypothetical protein
MVLGNGTLVSGSKGPKPSQGVLMASEIAERNRRIVERFLTEGVLEGRLDVF